VKQQKKKKKVIPKRVARHKCVACQKYEEYNGRPFDTYCNTEFFKQLVKDVQAHHDIKGPLFCDTSATSKMMPKKYANLHPDVFAAVHERYEDKQEEEEEEEETESDHQ
jgi:hypothetical protein